MLSCARLVAVNLSVAFFLNIWFVESAQKSEMRNRDGAAWRSMINILEEQHSVGYLVE